MADYATESEINTLLTSIISTAWDNVDSATRAIYISQGTDIIDSLNYIGKKTDPDQVNQFPRNNDTVVPDDIKKALAHICLALAKGVDLESEYEAFGLISQSYANVRSTYDRNNVAQDHLAAGVPSITAWRYLKPYLRDPRTIQLTRIN